ncbi:hypothetical protein TWF281_004187 [Arthrobotrys megalospora]
MHDGGSSTYKHPRRLRPEVLESGPNIVTNVHREAKMKSIDILPVEIHILILSHLSFPDQISALQVLPLWRAILTTPRFLKARYTELHHSDDGQNLHVHQLLYNEDDCDEDCVACSKTRPKGDSINCDPEYPFTRNSERPVFFTASIDPTSHQLTDYKLWIEICSQRDLDGVFIQKHREVSITADDLILNEPVFLASTPTKTKEEEKKKKEKVSKPQPIAIRGFIQYLSASASLVEINCGGIRAHTQMGVRELVQKTWDKLRDTYTEDQHSDMKSFKQVKFLFVSNSNISMGNWANGKPVFRVDLLVDKDPQQWGSFDFSKLPSRKR